MGGGPDIHTHVHMLPFLIQDRNESVPEARASVHLLPYLLDPVKEMPISLSPFALHWRESYPREVEGEEVLEIS